MGLLRAIITISISIFLVQFIYNKKNKFQNLPILNQLLPYFDDKYKSYIIIIIMFLIITLW